MQIPKFPKLYSITKSEKIKEWMITVSGNNKLGIITIETGFPGSKPTIFETKIDKGKNIGKKNETTPLDQAISEAKSKWNKKKDSGYTENKSGVSESNIILPMLAVKYTERFKDITFPCYMQKKLDGLRAITVKTDGKIALYSRKQNEFTHLDHILDELNLAMKSGVLNLDGELYSENDSTNKSKKVTARKKVEEHSTLTFQELSGLIRKKTVTEDDIKKLKNVIYIVYDIAVENTNYEDRLKLLKEFFKNNKFKYVKLLETEVCKSPEDVQSFHDSYVKEGYEGLILRNKLGYYEPKNRSKNLQKLKSFQDEEFKIVGFTSEDSATEKGAIIWKCITKDNKEFTVRPKGTMEQRRKLFKNGNKYIGEMLTVTFFDLSDEGIPFHATTRHGGEADIRSLEK